MGPNYFIFIDHFHGIEINKLVKFFVIPGNQSVRYRRVYK